MKKNNPAVFECPKGDGALHQWQRRDDGSAVCLNCRRTLTKEQTDDAFPPERGTTGEGR